MNNIKKLKRLRRAYVKLRGLSDIVYSTMTRFELALFEAEEVNMGFGLCWLTKRAFEAEILSKKEFEALAESLMEKGHCGRFWWETHLKGWEQRIKCLDSKMNEINDQIARLKKSELG